MADKEMEMEMEKEGGAIVGLVLDLMFAARIRGVAPGAALARTPRALWEAVGPGTRLVLVDLQAPGAMEALEGLSARSEGVRVVAWGPHVMEETLAAARAAGADAVMPRGAFVKALPELVASATTDT